MLAPIDADSERINPTFYRGLNSDIGSRLDSLSG